MFEARKDGANGGKRRKSMKKDTEELIFMEMRCIFI
jgi:hypothetical protein